MKFGPNWHSGLGGDINYCQMTDGRWTTNAEVLLTEHYELR